MAFPKHTKPMFIPHGGPDKEGAWTIVFLMDNNGQKYYQRMWSETKNSLLRMLSEMQRCYTN